ncbi:uncharacterized protein LOC134281136 [Saccostrea cucullata]|uniref:uncharacterized protein LOC134281136 n=1 Tax=Saccostrea cuccullata TaxID=36930 RepID=UPI002ED6B691
MAFADLDPISSENAQENLKYLKRTESRLFEKDFQTITKNAADETIFQLSKYSRFLTFYMSNCVTSRQYLRLSNYVSEPGEKCIINKSTHFDSLLIHRLMMDILVHKSIEGTSMSKQISQILHIPENIITESIDKREEFLRNLQQNGEEIPNKVKTNGESQHVKWLWKFQRHEVVRSCIGLYPHSDIYIINHKAYRKHSEYHEFPPNVRCLLYSLLFAEKSKLSLNDGAYKKIMLKIRDNFLPTLPISDEELNLPEGIAKSQSGEITFASADIRHKVMYAFVTECLMDDVNLEFFLKEASKQVLFEYCRSWNYERKDGERCLYVPNKPVEMYDLFIERLDLDIIKHCTLSDWTIRNSVTEKLKVPLEILNWDQRARDRYVEYAKKGTQIVHQSRAMLVGCAGAGKTTLLKRLLKCSAEDIYNVETTLGLEVHEEIFEISDETLKETEIKPDRESRDFEGELNAERLSVFDFGGQSVYYACHQIYLTRRAFYIVVVDASQELHQRVSETVCKQDDGVFGGWTFGDYFVFWMKSIHTYCATENKEGEKPIVLIVATHWEEEKRKFKTKEDFLCCLQKQLPQGSSLAQYIEKKNCYCINFPIQPITELEKRIASIARQERWKENIPKEWAFFGLELKQKKYAKRVIKISEIKTVPVDANDEEKEKKTSGMKRDMLRFYHDTGKILYFNENHLKDNVILDVQWFIDAFKIIITDNLNLEGIPADKKDLDEFSLTGRLHDKLLLGIWEHRDQEICEELALDKSQSTSKAEDARFISFHKELLLLYMQRLGLVAVGEEYHYIPCMNRKDVEKEISELILASKNRTSILIFKFKFLPFFFFFRLVVACMQEENWKVLQIEEIPCLYKNAALFYAGNYNIVMSVTIDSIQLQVLCAVPGISLEIEKTYKILNTVEDKLAAITQTFHQRVQYEKGIRCKEDEEKTVSSEILGYFLSKIDPADMECKICPHHRLRDVHEIDIEKLTKYWKLNLFKT